MKDKILVTGASGFLANELISRLQDEKIVALGRNEGNLVALKEKYPNVEIVVGDIDDMFVCDKACKDAKAIFHLAAMKHIGLAEQNTKECIESNVIGSMNLLECTLKYKPNFIVGVSTDKAAQVHGVYGATKLLMERLFKEYERVNPETKYRIVRYGNVLGSTGSVITKWKPLLEKGKEVVITNPDATRFFWTVQEAVDLIFDCLNNATDSKPYIPQMKAMSVFNLLRACMNVYGNPSSIKEIGLQDGESMHETMDGKIFSNEVEQYTIDEFIKKFL